MAGDRAQCDGQAVPRVDRGHHERKINDLFFVEEFADFFVDGIGNVGLGNQGDSFGPGQRGTFAIAVERGFPPGIEFVQTLLGLAQGACVLRV
jgi:hypothetical protein